VYVVPVIVFAPTLIALTISASEVSIASVIADPPAEPSINNASAIVTAPSLSNLNNAVTSASAAANSAKSPPVAFPA